MAQKYAECVKQALDKLDCDFQELTCNQENKKTYSAMMADPTGELSRRLKVTVDEGASSLTFQACLEADVPSGMHPEIYKLINEVQNRWYFVRMYLDGNDSLMADYKVILERIEASRVFQENVKRITQHVIDVSMKYAGLAHKAIHENEKAWCSRLAAGQINLNPFQEGGSYGI
ncbi:MAG: hypothetical protein HFH38_07295 [Lachnospiraceae bacterium]|jgi:hypothetical protein|nr:hypothetical protein [Lachnospiraceae bacterium]